MARTPEGEDLTQRFRRSQIAVQSRATLDVQQLYPIWEPGNAESYRQFERATQTLAIERHRKSAENARQYYQQFREAEQMFGQVSPAEVEFNEEQFRSSLDLSSRGGYVSARRRGFTPEAASRTALVLTTGSVARLVTNAGRDTVLQTAQRDGQVRGFQRITGAEPCAWCASIAGLGIATWDQMHFGRHDHDSCEFEVAYQGSRVLGRNQEFAERIREAAENEGLDPSDPQAFNAFRRAFEGS